MPRTGRPKGSGIVPPEERFWAKVDKNGPVPEHRPDLGPCWIWTAGTMKTGRPNFKVRSYLAVAAYRYAYELLVGPIPEGRDLDHLCRVIVCVNPAHLEPATRRENLLRRPRATHCMHGHEFTEANTWVESNGARHCRICDRNRRAKRRATLTPSPRR